MAGVDVGGGGGSHKKGKKTKKRMSIRIDMTPMVDVAFLLLTFFMLTTVFRKPQTMEINLPPDKKAQVEIAESNLITFRVDESANIFWNYGIDRPKKMAFKDLTKFLKEESAKNPKVVFLLKIDRKSKFHNMVDLIDELNVANCSRFSIAPINEIDKKEIAKAS